MSGREVRSQGDSNSSEKGFEAEERGAGLRPARGERHGRSPKLKTGKKPGFGCALMDDSGSGKTTTGSFPFCGKDFFVPLTTQKRHQPKAGAFFMTLRRPMSN